MSASLIPSLIPVLILAAGASSRMKGRDKLLEPVDGVPLLRAQIDKAATLGGPVFVAVAQADHPRCQVMRGSSARPLIAPNARDGMGVTLRETVAQLPACAAFMVLLGDLVELTADDLKAVRDTAQTQTDHVIWRGATADGKPGHPVIFAQSLRPAFAGLSGDAGADHIARTYAKQTHLVPLPADHARRDLDTPEDWATWRAETGRAG